MQPDRSRPSRYLRADLRNDVARRWAASLLLAGDLEHHLAWQNLEPSLFGLFERFGLSREELGDAAHVIPWLRRQLAATDGADFDEGDVFAINTRRLAAELGLDPLERDLLRFGLLHAALAPLRAAASVHLDSTSAIEASDALAGLLDGDGNAVFARLSADGRLRRAGLFGPATLYGGSGDLDSHLPVPSLLLRHVFLPQPDGAGIERTLFGRARRSSLTRRDFEHLGDALPTLLDYVRTSCRGRHRGANVLLWGAPGTGKSELARYLAKATRCEAVEIPAVDSDGDPYGAEERLDGYRLCQSVLPPRAGRFVLFDEVEEILSDADFARQGFGARRGRTKGGFNQLLESNPVPSVWITNTLEGVDPAFLRRFDLVLEIAPPGRAARRRMMRRAFRSLPLDPALGEAMVAHPALTPARLEKASTLCRRLGGHDASALARFVLDNDLQAAGHPPLPAPRRDRPGCRPPELRIDTDVLCTDVAIGTLLERVARSGFSRLCLHGAPGTGKSALAAQIAARLEKPLIVRHPADLLDKYVGGTERAIAEAFAEAAERDGVLVLDEVDSFLGDRRFAVRTWEVTQVNQLLSSLERHAGCVVCTTNRLERIDPATLRRFDFKVRFGPLGRAQCERMLALVMEALGRGRGETGCEGSDPALLERLAGVRPVPGDFVVALRQAAIDPARASARAIVEAVVAESRLRDPLPASIGFVRA